MATERGNNPLFRWPKKGPLTSKIERPNSTVTEPIWTFKERPCNVAVLAGKEIKHLKNSKLKKNINYYQ